MQIKLYRFNRFEIELQKYTWIIKYTRTMILSILLKKANFNCIATFVFDETLQCNRIAWDSNNLKYLPVITVTSHRRDNIITLSPFGAIFSFFFFSSSSDINPGFVVGCFFSEENGAPFSAADALGDFSNSLQLQSPIFKCHFLIIVKSVRASRTVTADGNDSLV